APRSLIFSTRLYRAMLLIYPSDFRRAYEIPMLQTFRDCCLQALRENGNSGLFILWVRTILHILQSSIEEHSQRGVDMSKIKFIKLSGWALIFGSQALALSLLASTRPNYNPNSTASLPIVLLAKTTQDPVIIMEMLF